METKTQAKTVSFAFSVDEVSEQDIINYARPHLKAYGYIESEDEEYDLDHYRMIATSAKINKGAYNWAMGDMIVHMRQRMGRLTEAIMHELSDISGEEISTLYNYATTSENWWDRNRRVLDMRVSFSHHAELNGLPEDVQNKLIAKARNEKLSVAKLRKEKDRNEPSPEPITGAIDQTIPDIGNEENSIAPENNLNGIGGNSSQSTEDKPRPDNEYEQLADELEGDADAYSWGHEVEDDRRGLTTLAADPIAAAGQMVALLKTGAINEGWIATFIAALTQKMGV